MPATRRVEAFREGFRVSPFGHRMRCPTCHRRVEEQCPLHLATEPRPPLMPTPPPEVPGYRVEAPLGRGGFGRVFSARREADGREVALKVLESLAGERLGRELEALRRIGAPVAPALLGEAVTTTGEPVVVMERISGVTLARQLAELPGTGARTWTEARPLLLALARALAEVHAVSVAHRDLKPENIMLAGERLVLLDFGLARLGARDDSDGPAPTLTRTGQRLGTHEYMSPEQCRDARAIDARADLYSLGVLFFEVLSGRPPFVGDAATVLQAHVSRRPPALASLAPWAVPAEVEALVQRLLAKDPGGRFPSAVALVEALVGIPEHPAEGGVARSASEGPSVADGGSGPTPLASDATAPRAGPLPPSGDTPKGPRDVAVLGVRTRLDAPSLLALVAPLGAEPARVDAGFVLFAFPHAATVEVGLRAALKASESLAPALPDGSLRALHCAPLRVRERAGRVTVGGAALEKPERWWPALTTAPPEDNSVTLTPEARARLAWTETERTPPPEPASAAIDALLGRERELAWLGQGFARVREVGAPALLTLLGEEGLGKTRLLVEWHLQLQATPGVSSLRVEAPSDEGSASESGLRNLIATVLGLPANTPPDEAVRHLLDASGSVSRMQATHPAARRQLIARALAARLWQLASAQPLVLLVDDAHTLDPTALDALELATLADVRAPLAVVLAGRHHLLGLRPYLGERAHHSDRLELAPLPEDASRELLRRLLRPVDLPPEGVLRELVVRCGGSPLRMTETVRALRAAGALRLHTGGGGYLAADALHGLAGESPGPDERLAERSLAALPSGPRALLQVAALLGDDVRLEEMSATLANLDFSTDLDLSMDVGVGLERLARLGMLAPRWPGRWRFEHPTLREAFAALLPPAPRRRVAAAALRALPRASEARRARLAEDAGDASLALALHRALAESGRRAHRLVEAERHYSAALGLLPRDEDSVRMELLSGRGRVRYRLQRIDDALEDLRAARALAERHGDAVREADLLLEEATALDWRDDTAGSTALLEQALHRLGDTVPAELAGRRELAQARVIVRQGDVPGAIPALERAVEAARATSDVETEAIALAMQGAMLAWAERLEESERRFEEAIGLCEATGDTLHLGVALNNRVVLRIQRRDVTGARADLERAVSLGRELGNVQIERTSAFNLAELLSYQGRAAEALPLARRAGVLSQRFFPGSMGQDALLVARLCCELGDLSESARQLSWLDEPAAAQTLSAPALAMCAVVRRVVAEAQRGVSYDASAWTALVDEARRQLTPDDCLEVLVWAARAARTAGDTEALRKRLDEAHEAARGAPLWSERVRALAEESGGSPEPSGPC